jgi:hypothetical protein
MSGAKNAHDARAGGAAAGHRRRPKAVQAAPLSCVPLPRPPGVCARSSCSSRRRQITAATGPLSRDALVAPICCTRKVPAADAHAGKGPAPCVWFRATITRAGGRSPVRGRAPRLRRARAPWARAVAAARGLRRRARGGTVVGCPQDKGRPRVLLDSEHVAAPRARPAVCCQYRS